jgi:GntR family transcriptional regulator, transcriptional repressor for pyruvate dehydrogenase complex
MVLRKRPFPFFGRELRSDSSGDTGRWPGHLTSYHLPATLTAMALQPVTRRSVPDEVFEQIAADVLSGEMKPGEALPSERRLAELLGVSRPTVREALKRLTAAGLVEVRQGGATIVRDFRRHAGLDLLPRLLFRDGKLDTAVVHSILEVAHSVLAAPVPKVAELAAERHGPELAELLDGSLRAMETEDDLVEWLRHVLTFWDHVVDGAGSIVFRLMCNAFRAAVEPALPALVTVIGARIKRPGAYRKLTDGYRKLADAICAGDPAAAKNGAQDLFEFAATLLEVSDSLENQR